MPLVNNKLKIVFSNYLTFLENDTQQFTSFLPLNILESLNTFIYVTNIACSITRKNLFH